MTPRFFKTCVDENLVRVALLAMNFANTMAQETHANSTTNSSSSSSFDWNSVRDYSVFIAGGCVGFCAMCICIAKLRKHRAQTQLNRVRNGYNELTASQEHDLQQTLENAKKCEDTFSGCVRFAGSVVAEMNR